MVIEKFAYRFHSGSCTTSALLYLAFLPLGNVLENFLHEFRVQMHHALVTTGCSLVFMYQVASLLVGDILVFLLVNMSAHTLLKVFLKVSEVTVVHAASFR